MNQLDPEARDRAIAFVLERALPLDRALCRHHLLGGDMKGVLDEVTALQNPDGGFRGMEADFQDEASSVLCTLRALEILGSSAVARSASAALSASRAVYVPGGAPGRSFPATTTALPSLVDGSWS